MAEAKARQRKLPFVILASTLGTAFEGYDFFIFGVLSTILAQHFFSGLPASVAFVLTLLTFAVGFVTRPLGAIVFGRFGDKRGRKSAFLATIVLMGIATALIGVLPTYDDIGLAAPALLILCRLLQGFALGGEYGGAVVYVAEHSASSSRGMNTAWIQTTGSIGLLAALGVILGCRSVLGEAAFAEWGWRVPFLVSLLLLALSLLVRTRLHESPVFEQMRESQQVSHAPIRQALLKWTNLKVILIVLFGIMAPTGAIFYTGQFYLQFFLERIGKVEPATVNAMVLTATLLASPLFVLFGWLSDKIGRKPPILFGLALALMFAAPAYSMLTEAANPTLIAARERAPIVLRGAAADCGIRFNMMSGGGGCRDTKAALASLGVPFTIVLAEGPTSLSAGERTLSVDRGVSLAAVADLVAEAGYPARADPARVNEPMIVAVLLFFALCIAAISGPTAAALSELFPPQVRYIAVSAPYHIGLGWFGGFMPAIGFALMEATGDLLSGLWYPLGITALGFVICALLLKEPRGREWTAPIDQP